MTGSVRKLPTGEWVADVTINKRRRTAQRKTKAEAMAARRELVEELSRSPVAAAGVFTVEKARRLSLRIRWAGTAGERTAALYTASIVEHFGAGADLGSITVPQIEEWRQALLAKGNRPATINKKVSALRSMFSDAVLHGHLTQAPAVPQQLRLSNTRDRVISPEEERAFCRFFQERGEPAAADLLVFLLQTAARWGEAERLRGEDVDLARGRVTFWQTKSGRPRSVPLTRRAVDALRPHLPAVPGHRVWPYSYSQMVRLWNAAKAAMDLEGDEALTIHTTRHTCASHLAAKGIPLHQLMAFGGWSSLASVQRYLHLHTDALAACAAALEA